MSKNFCIFRDFTLEYHQKLSQIEQPVKLSLQLLSLKYGCISKCRIRKSI